MSRRWDVPPASGFVFAHRGASALAPENTVQAFVLAAELGAAGIELDVQLSRDQVPVVLHDPFLVVSDEGVELRAPAGIAAVRRLWARDCSWEELAALRVRHPNGVTAAIARLEDVFEAVPAPVWIDVELKAGALYDPRLVETVVACLRARPERVVLSSFDHHVLAEAARAAPEVPAIAILHARPVDLRVVTGPIPAEMVSIDWPFLTAADARRWRDEGFVVMVGGSEVAAHRAELSSWPVDAVFVDDPR